MYNAKGSQTNLKKAVTAFSLCILAFKTLLGFFYWVGGWEILSDYFFGDSSCDGMSMQCLFQNIVVLLLVYFASYSYGIILGLGVLRGILRIKGNYFGTFAYALIGAVPALLVLIPSPLYLLVLDITISVVLATALAFLVGVAAGFGYVKEGWGFSSWIRVLGVVSVVFFVIIGIAFLFSSIRGWPSYF